MRSRLLVAGAVVVLALGALTVWMLRSLPARVERVIEGVGSELTGTAVRVGSVGLDLSEGRGTVRDLRIGNPEGFSSKPVLRFDEITLGLDVSSLAGSPVVLTEAVFLAPVVRVEIDDVGRSNVAVILEHLRRDDDPPPPDGDGDAATLLRVEQFRFQDGRIEGDASALGEEERTLRLPGVRFSGLGGAGGATPAALGQRLLLRYLGHVAAVAAKDATFRYLEQKADELGDQVGEAAKGFLGVLRGDSGERAAPD